MVHRRQPRAQAQLDVDAEAWRMLSEMNQTVKKCEIKIRNGKNVDLPLV
jgi:hypothetical protein